MFTLIPGSRPWRSSRGSRCASSPPPTGRATSTPPRTPRPPPAAATFHFRPTGATFGYLDASQAPGTMPVYRLRQVGVQAYLVTPDPAEMHALVASGHFTLEGRPRLPRSELRAGALSSWRLSEPGTSFWRLATTAQKNQLTTEGWHLGAARSATPSRRPPAEPGPPRPTRRPTGRLQLARHSVDQLARQPVRLVQVLVVGLGQAARPGTAAPAPTGRGTPGRGTSAPPPAARRGRHRARAAGRTGSSVCCTSCTGRSARERELSSRHSSVSTRRTSRRST